MKDYGASVSQKGYDVKTCADRFLVYSSAFGSLKVFNTYSVSGLIPAVGGATTTITITHNIGYYAPFVVVYNGNSYYGVGESYFQCDSVGNALVVKQYTNSLTIEIPDWFDNYGSYEETAYFTVYLFLEDFSTVSEANINSGTSSGASSIDYGIRVSKSGFDVKTCTNIDCVMSSSFPTNIVHKKGIDTSGAEDVAISHNLGYVPANLFFTRYTGDSYIIFNLPRATSSSVSILTGGDTDVYYIIFKQRTDG